MASPCDNGTMVGPSVVGLEIRQRWRERKVGRRSCGANPKGMRVGGGGAVSPQSKQRGKWGSARAHEEEKGGPVWGGVGAKWRSRGRGLAPTDGWHPGR
jgi:hypothetical protein